MSACFDLGKVKSKHCERGGRDEGISYIVVTEDGKEWVVCLDTWWRINVPETGANDSENRGER